MISNKKNGNSQKEVSAASAKYLFSSSRPKHQRDQDNNTNEQSKKFSRFLYIRILHLSHIVEKHCFVFLPQPFKNSRYVDNAVKNIQHEESNRKLRWIKLEDCHDTQHRHGAVNQDPDDRIRVVDLDKGEQ